MLVLVLYIYKFGNAFVLISRRKSEKKTFSNQEE